VIFGATAVISVLRGETTQTYAIGSFVALGVLSGILSFKEMMETFNKTVK
jgi:DNA-directed RNA polymerase subunit E'/Rpb7